jgi:hypothetical protein
MALILTATERAALVAEAGERRVRHRRRYRALRLLAQGQRPAAVTTAVGCSEWSLWC